MKIKFLGTSYGAPSKDRHQQSCLVEINDDLYLFDTGAPVLDILIKNEYDLSKIKAVFISHIHGDHLNGIFDMLNLAGYLNMSFTVYVAEEKGIELLKYYSDIQTDLLKTEKVKFELIEEGRFYDDCNLNVTAFKTKHSDASFGFLIEDEKSRIFITGDLSSSLNDFPEILYLKQTDLIITECAHFSVESLFDKLKLCVSESFAIVHVAPSEKYDALKTVAAKSKLKVYFPDDNDEIKL